MKQKNSTTAVPAPRGAALGAGKVRSQPTKQPATHGTAFGEAILLCPRCAVRMKKLKNGDTIIDVCDSCGGMWLDKGEVEKLAARHPSSKHGNN